MNKSRIIIFVSGVDSNLVNFEIDGFRLCKDYVVRNPQSDLISDKKSVSFLGELFASSREFDYKIDSSEGAYYLYFSIYQTDLVRDHERIYKLKNSLRLFKNSRVGFLHPLHVNDVGGCCYMPDPLHNYHSLYEYNPLFMLDCDEVQQFTILYNRMNLENHPNKIMIEKMFDLFDESYRVHSQQMKFILRVIIIEMLIDGNSELMYRLSRFVSVLLGRTYDESISISEDLKKIYSARSNYLHEGNNNIDFKYCSQAHDFARRLIVSLICEKTDIRTIRKKLNESAFGSNPFNISF